MKIYFSGSIRGGRNDAELYKKIISYLKTKGEVLTEHIGNISLSSEGQIHIKDTTIHDQDMDFLLDSDIVIAEVTNPSLGVGYEIGRAIENHKRVVCFYRPRSTSKLSAMISGSRDIEVIEYDTIESATLSIDRIFK